MKVTVSVLFGMMALVLAEPPVPSSQYLPGNSYSTQNPDSFSPPSQNYGAPSRPSSNYGAPSSGHTTAILRPNSQYGAPSGVGSNYLPPTSSGNNGYASNGGYSGGNKGGYGGSGGSGGYDEQSEPANYNFKYDVQDPPSGNDFGHEESRQGDVARGRYYVLLPDGRRQVVEYVADSEGYKPKITYEQVGGGYQGGGGGYPSGGSGAGAGGGAGGYPSGGGGGYQY